MTEREWEQRVQAAELSADERELRELFEVARALFGPRAAHRWAEALSAYDSSAVTG